MTPTADLMKLVKEMLDAYQHVPCTWGRIHDKEEIAAAKAALTASCDARVGGEFDNLKLQSCWLVELFVPGGSNSLACFHTGFTDIGGYSRTTKNPHEARKYDTKEQAEAAASELFSMSGEWKAIEHGFYVATPAQPKASRVCPNTLALCECDKFGPCAKQAQPKASETEKDSECKEADGCPTEKAVLQRFWRAHHPKASEGKAGGEVGFLRVECRQCDECEHVGIDDATDAATCSHCDWRGIEPVDDKCPECLREGTMNIGCPECGARYRLLAEAEIKPLRAVGVGHG